LLLAKCLDHTDLKDLLGILYRVALSVVSSFGQTLKLFNAIVDQLLKGALVIPAPCNGVAIKPLIGNTLAL